MLSSLGISAIKVCYAVSLCLRIPTLLLRDTTGNVQESHELARDSDLPS